jgi:anti-anti-sigma regulatory factor
VSTREVSLLRITRVIEGSWATTLRVEGRIVAEWVAVLERECWLAFEDKRPVRLDLSAVRFIDSSGVAALRHLGANGFEFFNCPEFVREFLRTP